MCDGNEVRFMRFEKGEDGREKAPFADPGAKLICIQPGEVKEPLGAPFVVERRGKRLKCKRFRVGRRVICGVAQHRLSAGKE